MAKDTVPKENENSVLTHPSRTQSLRGLRGTCS